MQNFLSKCLVFFAIVCPSSFPAMTLGLGLYMQDAIVVLSQTSLVLLVHPKHGPLAIFNSSTTKVEESFKFCKLVILTEMITWRDAGLIITSCRRYIQLRCLASTLIGGHIESDQRATLDSHDLSCSFLLFIHHHFISRALNPIFVPSSFSLGLIRSPSLRVESSMDRD